MMKTTLLFLAMFLTGCATIQPVSFVQYQQQLQQVQQQTASAFRDANELARDQAVAYILSTTRPVITEEDFTPAISPKSAAEWDNVFNKMTAYVTALQGLNSTDGSKFGAAVTNLGNELRTGKVGLNISPEVAQAAGSWGERLIVAAAQHETVLIARKADPGVRATFTAMANAIGEDNQHGLRGTVWSNWQSKIALGPLVAYAQAVKAGDKDARKAQIDSFLTLVDQRDKQVAALTALRHSLLLLADAHHSLSQGQSVDALATLSFISQHLDDVKSLSEMVNTWRKEQNGGHSKSNSGGTTRPSGAAGGNPVPVNGGSH